MVDPKLSLMILQNLSSFGYETLLHILLIQRQLFFLSIWTLFNGKKIFCSKEKVRGVFNKFPDFFLMGIYNCRTLLKIQYVIAIHRMRWLTNVYDFRFKRTPTAGIGKRPTKAWLSQLVNFKNAIWTRRRTICKKNLFKTWKKCHRNVWNASDCFSTMIRASVFEWHKRFKEGRQSVRDDGRCGRSKEVNTPQLIGQRVRVTVTMLRF